jgi:hypothetical protein
MIDNGEAKTLISQLTEEKLGGQEKFHNIKQINILTPLNFYKVRKNFFS